MKKNHFSVISIEPPDKAKNRFVRNDRISQKDLIRRKSVSDFFARILIQGRPESGKLLYVYLLVT